MVCHSYSKAEPCLTSGGGAPKMVCHSYGKAEPCLTSGGGAPNLPAIGFAQSFCSWISQIYQCRFNGFSWKVLRNLLKRLTG